MNAQIQNLSKNPKALIVGAVLIFAAIFFIFRKKKTTDTGTGNTGSGSTAGANITAQEAKQIAEAQLNAMDRFGTDTTSLFRTLQGVNAAGLRLIYAKFGRVKYALTGKATLMGYPLDLGGWYVRELDSKELNKMREVWKATGIRF